MAEPIRVKGIVLRETPVGEADKMMTLLTASKGRISVFGRGVRRLKNPHFVATQTFCYSDFILTQVGDTYYIREVSLIESFYKLRSSLEGLALAEYLADVAGDVSTDRDDHTELLRLLLNALHLIAEGKKSLTLIKAVFELRTVALAGFMPDLVGCAGCGNYKFPVYYLDLPAGVFRCEDCFHKCAGEIAAEQSGARPEEGIYAGAHLIMPLSPDVFVAMRYTLYSGLEKIFSFELKGDALFDFALVAERYLLCHLDREFGTLSFFRSVEKI